MSSVKVRPYIHSEGREIIKKVIEFCDEETIQEEFKIPIRNATKRAAEVTGKSEATICKIRKESKTISNDEKLSNNIVG
ncbi:hypothetical protein L9F63_020949 [Diploptera punctata]|uniref:Uncharacterized protein n=1 Tax=Diploptera punctata TaxID=6984 RepID=A0AAD7ZQI5_DIPPU|nr:hypothetical protein L9F63_020949 [Diploptera punctata]